MGKEKILLKKNAAIVLSLCFTLSAMTGCGMELHKEEGALYLVTTTTMLSDLAGVIGQGRLQVQGLMGPGIDPHSYKASAGAVETMRQADVILYSGLELEGKLGRVLEQTRQAGTPVICAVDLLDPEALLPTEDAAEYYDPHFWFDVRLWASAASGLAEALAELDPEYARLYRENAASYLEELSALEEYVAERTGALPPEQRILITAHDAFRYFGRAYGFTVVGLQGISTQSEAGTADISALAEYIAQNRVRAVFVESSVPTKTVEALQAAVLSRGQPVEIGGALYSDSLGDQASGTETYIKTVRANVDTIVGALL